MRNIVLLVKSNLEFCRSESIFEALFALLLAIYTHGDDHHQEEDLKVIWNFEQEQPNSTIFKDRAHFSCEVYH